MIRIPSLTAVSLIVLCTTLSGCWNGDVSNVRLANVSLGQQLIDLKRALEEEALSEDEFEEAREKLINLYAVCESNEED